LLVYDPPDGWRYGFPKAYKPLPGESLRDTLKRDGYPEKLMDIAENHTRFIGSSEELNKLFLRREEEQC
jgi:hypothetical protein